MRSFYLDSCVFLSIINGDPVRTPQIRPFFEAADGGKIEIVTSVLSITEVAYANHERAGKALDDEVLKKINRLWHPESPVILIEVDQLIVNEARSLLRHQAVSGLKGTRSIDAMHLATAKILEVNTFLSYDTGMHQWASHLAMEIQQPDSSLIAGPQVPEAPMLEFGNAPN